MATAGIPLWSTTASNNSTADPAINFAEGMAASAVNDSGRALMASVAKWRDDLYGIATGGTSTAYTVATGSTFLTTAAMSGVIFTIIPHTTSGASPTLAVDGLTAYALNISTGVAVPTGALVSGTPYLVKYVHASTEFIVLGGVGALGNATVTGTLAVTGASTFTGAVTANGGVSTTTGSFSGVLTQSSTSHGILASGTTAQRPGTPAAAQFRYNSTLGATEYYNGSAWKQPQTAPPVAGGFKNLSIKVASNTQVSVNAEFVTTTDGTLYQTTAVSATINLGSSGAVNTLDSGIIAIDTWYAVWVIAKADGTTGALASTSFTAPTMPTGYTYKARVGAVQTIHGSATLYGTWQFGRRAQYVVGLAQTTAIPIMATGPAGSTSVPTWVAVSTSRFVPSTASVIYGATRDNGNTLMVAPNGSYGAATSTTNPPPVATNGGSSNPVNIPFSFVLESSNIYWSGLATTAIITALGWEDNI